MKNVSGVKDMTDKVSKETAKRLKDVGIDMETPQAGTYIYEDDAPIVSDVSADRSDDVVILDMKKALEQYDWLRNYLWTAVDKDKDEYTKALSEEEVGGYFMWVKKDAHVDIPIQSCLLISEKDFKQKVHNVVIVEDGARVNILSGCLTHENVHTAEHIGISEFFVGKHASLNFTMIHDWSDGAFVRPRTGVFVAEGGHYISNYIVLSTVKDLQTSPNVYLKGERSKATMNSLLYGKGQSRLDVGGNAILNGKHTQAEIISRSIAIDSSTLIANGRIEGNHPESKAHLECQGLLLSENATIHAIPELLARKEGTDLSHEAAVGKISEEEIIYLMARGLSEEQARSVIVRGFLDVKILGLPESFEKKTKELIDRISVEGD